MSKQETENFEYTIGENWNEPHKEKVVNQQVSVKYVYPKNIFAIEQGDFKNYLKMLLLLALFVHMRIWLA